MSTEYQIQNIIKKIDLLINYLVKPTISIPKMRDLLWEIKKDLNKIVEDRRKDEK